MTMREVPGLIWLGLWWHLLVFLPQAAAASNNDVYIVPFSHLDLFWAGTREECLSRGNRIIEKAVRLAQQQPQFRFLLEDNVFVANYVESRRGTTELETFKMLVKEGRIAVAPKWVGIYQNLPRGEAHVRNHIIGKQFARAEFGVDPQVSHLGDLPGYTLQYPQLLAKSRIPFAVMTRMGPPDCALFRWCAPDGSSALVWNAIKGYGWGIGLGLHRDMDSNRLMRVAREVEQVRATTGGPIYMGWGTDLWAPSEKLVQNVTLLNRSLSPLTFRLATPDEFFKAAAGVKNVPEFAGEIPSSWANIVTSMAHLWHPVIFATDTLLLAETFSAINHALGYAEYPQAEFDRLWKMLLQAMDHNNFGQGGFMGDARKLELAQLPGIRANLILSDMLRNIAERVQIPHAQSAAIVVFNPLSWPRTDIVRTHVSLYGDVGAGEIPQWVKLVDASGRLVPYYEELSYGTVSRAREIVFLAQDVPPLGYKTYYLVQADKTEAFTNTAELKLDAPDPTRPKRILGSDQLETDSYRVRIDRVTGQISVFDKGLGREIFSGIELVAAEMRGGNSLSQIPRTGRVLPNTILQVEVQENNPVRAVVRLECDLAGVPVTQKLTLYRGLKRIDLENVVEWKATKLLQLEQLFRYPDSAPDIYYGVPFGAVSVTNILPKAGPRAGDEVPFEEWKTWRQIQDWVYVGTSEGGFSLAADRQFVVVEPGVLKFPMLRGTFQTTGLTKAGKPVLLNIPPPGKYVFRYSITSGKGNWKLAKSYRHGAAFSNPLIAVTSVDELGPKPLPPSGSFCAVDADNLVVTALKKAEQGNWVVLRVVEMEGAPAETQVEFLGKPRRFNALNLLEEPADAAWAQLLRVRPFEISTLRLSVE